MRVGWLRWEGYDGVRVGVMGWELVCWGGVGVGGPWVRVGLMWWGRSGWALGKSGFDVVG